MSTPATLPANFFESKTGQASPPKTLPANFDFTKQASPESQRPDATKQAQAAMPKMPMSVAEMTDTPYVKDMMKSNVDAAGFGADMLAGGELLKAGKSLFAPTTITKAGPLVPGGRDVATGRMLPWIKSQITGEGPSLAKQGVSKVVSGAKDVSTWLKANPVKAVAIEGIAHELGVDPIQLARKIIKYGASAVP